VKACHATRSLPRRRAISVVTVGTPLVFPFELGAGVNPSILGGPNDRILLTYVLFYLPFAWNPPQVAADV